MFALTIAVAGWVMGQVPESLEPVSAASFPHSVERTEIRRAEGPGGAVLYQYAVRIGDAGDGIPLGTMQQMGRERMGFDEKSFQLRWLARDAVLHLHWTTVPEGIGRYQVQGNVVAIKAGGEWREVFRDYRAFHVGHGYKTFGGTTLRFAWDADDDRLHLFVNAFGSNRLESTGPLAESERVNETTTIFLQRSGIEREWVGELVDGAIIFGQGKEFFTAVYERDPFPLKEIAAFLEARYHRSNQLPVLMALNPGLGAESLCPERVLIADSIPPFEPDREERWLP